MNKQIKILQVSEILKTISKHAVQHLNMQVKSSYDFRNKACRIKSYLNQEIASKINTFSLVMMGGGKDLNKHTKYGDPAGRKKTKKYGYQHPQGAYQAKNIKRYKYFKN